MSEAATSIDQQLRDYLDDVFQGENVYFPTCNVCHEQEARIPSGKCKRCYNKDQYRKNRDDLIARGKARYQKNRDKILANSKARYHANVDVSRAKQNTYKKDWTNDNPGYYLKPKYRFSRAKYYAKERELNFTLTRSAYEALIQVPCTYCSGFFPPTTSNIGLDRIDNAKGYEPSNVLPCCGTCNQTRNQHWSVEETKAMIQLGIKIRKASNAK